MTTSLRSFAEPVNLATVEKAAEALRSHGMDARIVARADVVRLVDALIPDGATIRV